MNDRYSSRSRRDLSDMDWNVVVTAYDWQGVRRARRLLSRYGEVARTEFHNVLVLRVADVAAFLEAISAAAEHDASLHDAISRIMPAQTTFAFKTADEFQENARAVARQWAERIAGGPSTYGCTGAGACHQ